MAGNRVLNELKIKRIINDIDSGLNMLKHCPIVVNEDMVIIDGQHRFQVCKILKQPVFYVIAKNISLYDIARVNSRTERWKPIDFVRCYAELGNKNYVKLMEFLNTFEAMPVTSALFCMAIDGGSVPNGHIMRKFERGEFVVKDYQAAQNLAIKAGLFETETFTGHFSVSFLKALFNIINSGLCDFERLQEKLPKAQHMLTSCTNWKGYAQQLESIYNYNNQKRIAIY